MTTNWLFTNNATVRSNEVKGEGKRGRDGGEKMRSRGEKLCQDPSQVLGEIKLPYGFAVNRKYRQFAMLRLINLNGVWRNIFKSMQQSFFYFHVFWGIFSSYPRPCCIFSSAVPSCGLLIEAELSVLSLFTSSLFPLWLSGHASFLLFGSTPLPSAAAPKPCVMWSETLAY